jgi:hypothetical protein
MRTIFEFPVSNAKIADRLADDAVDSKPSPHGKFPVIGKNIGNSINSEAIASLSSEVLSRVLA